MKHDHERRDVQVGSSDHEDSMITNGILICYFYDHLKKTAYIYIIPCSHQEAKLPKQFYSLKFSTLNEDNDDTTQMRLGGILGGLPNELSAGILIWFSDV